LQSLMPFRYVVQAKNNTIISCKILNKNKKHRLCLLYTFTKNGYRNNLNAEFVLNMVE